MAKVCFSHNYRVHLTYIRYLFPPKYKPSEVQKVVHFPLVSGSSNGSLQTNPGSKFDFVCPAHCTCVLYVVVLAEIFANSLRARQRHSITSAKDKLVQQISHRITVSRTSPIMITSWTIIIGQFRPLAVIIRRGVNCSCFLPGLTRKNGVLVIFFSNFSLSRERNTSLISKLVIYLIAIKGILSSYCCDHVLSREIKY